MGRNFPPGRYSQTRSRDAVPRLASPTGTMRRSCASGQPLPALPESLCLGHCPKEAPFTGQLNLKHPQLHPRGTGSNLQIHPAEPLAQLELARHDLGTRLHASGSFMLTPVVGTQGLSRGMSLSVTGLSVPSSCLQEF